MFNLSGVIFTCLVVIITCYICACFNMSILVNIYICFETQECDVHDFITVLCSNNMNKFRNCKIFIWDIHVLLLSLHLNQFACGVFRWSDK